VTALFSSDTKFESGTGWPSFGSRLRRDVEKIQDRTFGMTRTLWACRLCDAHLGHALTMVPSPPGCATA